MINKFKQILVIPILVFLFTSCIPPIHDAPPDPRTFGQSDTDLFELGYSLPYFEDFMYAMEKTHLTYLLEEDGPYTVFVPVQASFAKFRMENKISHIDQLPEDKLSDILRYHFIPGRWMISNIATGYHSTLLVEKTSGNPIDLYVTKDGVFRLNGINVIDEPDLESKNGYIQSIKYVLNIPTVLDHLSVNNEFSMIFNMLNRKDLDEDLKRLLSEDSPYTLLAPNDEAILSFIDGNPSWKKIDDIPDQTLNKIIENHLISNGNVVLNNLKEDLTLTSMNGRDITVHIDYPKWSIRDKAKKLATITIRDIQGVNGIIHQIDQVLLP